MRNRNVRISVAVVVAALSLVLMPFSAAAQGKVTLGKPLDDGGGALGQKVADITGDTSPGGRRRSEAVKPFVMGYYGWNLMGITQLGIAKLETIRINIDRLVLNLYDPELDPVLKAIVARNQNSATDWGDPTEAESKAIQEFVVQKWTGKYTGISSMLESLKSGRPEEPKNDPAEQWKFKAGMALGEFGASLINWYKLPNNDKYVADINKKLASLTEGFDPQKRPADVPAAFLDNIKNLQALGGRTSYTDNEKQALAAMLRTTLLSFVGDAAAPATASQPAKPTVQKPAVKPPARALLSTAADHIKRGDELGEQGKYLEAIKEYDAAVTLAPSSGEAYFKRALAYDKAEMTAPARADFTNAIELKYNTSVAYFNRGTLSMRDFPRSAIEDFSAALRLDPSNADIYFNRGWTYNSLMQYDRTIEDMTKVISLSPKYLRAYMMRALAYCKQGLPQEAIADLKTANSLGANATLSCPK